MKLSHSQGMDVDGVISDADVLGKLDMLGVASFELGVAVYSGERCQNIALCRSIFLETRLKRVPFWLWRRIQIGITASQINDGVISQVDDCSSQKVIGAVQDAAIGIIYIQDDWWSTF